MVAAILLSACRTTVAEVEDASEVETDHQAADELRPSGVVDDSDSEDNSASTAPIMDLCLRARETVTRSFDQLFVRADIEPESVLEGSEAVLELFTELAEDLASECPPEEHGASLSEIIEHLASVKSIHEAHTQRMISNLIGAFCNVAEDVDGLELEPSAAVDCALDSSGSPTGDLNDNPPSQEWWETFGQPLGGCFRDYYGADYLSAEAQRAATCIVDELFFSGIAPSTEATSNLLPEIFFVATWATWEAVDREMYCELVRDGGFEQSEDLSASIVNAWQSQIAAAGSNWQMHEHDLVLDLLDACT